MIAVPFRDYKETYAMQDPRSCLLDGTIPYYSIQPRDFYKTMSSKRTEKHRSLTRSMSLPVTTAKKPEAPLSEVTKKGHW